MEKKSYKSKKGIAKGLSEFFNSNFKILSIYINKVLDKLLKYEQN